MTWRFFTPTKSVSVVGIGSEAVLAEKASVTFIYNSSNTNRAQAVTQGEQVFNRIITDLRGLEPERLRRIPYQVIPVPTQNADGTIGERYEYASGAEVVVSGLSNISAVTRIIENSQGTIVDISYVPSEEDNVRSRVQQKALENAREKAEDIARASGGRLGGVLVVTEQGSDAETGSGITSLGMDPDSQGSGNEIEVRSIVTVTFQLR